MTLFILSMILSFTKLLVGILTFPIAVVAKIDVDGSESEILIGMFCVVSYLFIMYFSHKRSLRNLKEPSVIIKVGVALLLGFSKCILLTIQHMGYDDDYIIVYNILLFAMIFSVIVLGLWLFDKSQEQKRLQEMTAYVHRTREVIPSMSRMLHKLEGQSEYEDKSSEIIRELKLICDGDMSETRREASVIKTFETTECFALDVQLERYLEEAAEQGFELDIVVRASVKEILDEKKIELYSLLQVVGDLYRNAYKAVLSNETQGRILICFGYNREGYYEISIHDNGPLFPEYVLRHLGERGVTTGGTGHGMADIFEVLERNQISYVLNQDLPEGGIFTKSICIVFDDKGDREMHCR